VPREEIMPLPVSLNAVVDEMEMLGGEADLHAFLNRTTGELYGGTADQLATAEETDDDDDLLEWEAEMIRRLRDVLASVDWLELPRRDAHEDYRVMERFCLERTEGLLQEELLAAIAGRGAFGRFKDAVHRHGIRDGWYAFRREWIAAEAAAWLDAHGISYRP
jgi:hypothetical protein